MTDRNPVAPIARENAMRPDERELLLRHRNGDSAAFAGLVAGYRRPVFSYLVRCSVAESDREDLFQEIATQVWNSVPKYRGDSAVTTWIYRVALYSAMAWSRKERRHRDNHRTLDGLDYPLLQASKIKNPRLDWLYERISKLDEIDRSLTLLMLDGFSYREIGATLGITESHVGVKLNRIKKRLTEQSIEEISNGI